MAGKSLLDNQFSSTIERAIERAVGFRISAIRPKPIWNLDNQNEAHLDWIAETLNSISWWTGYNKDGKIAAIKEAVNLHRLRGTPASFTLFGRLAGVAIRWEIADALNTDSEILVHFYISPSVYSDSTSEWQEYVKRVLRILLPFWLTLGNLNVIIVYEAKQYILSTAQAIEIKADMGYA